MAINAPPFSIPSLKYKTLSILPNTFTPVFLTCETQNAKRYKAPLLLTELGLKAGKKIAEKIDSVLDKTSVGLSEEERAVFYRGLSIISENLEILSANNENKE